MEKNEIVIDGKEYVLKSSIKETKLATPKKGLKYCIVRTYSAGVFAGYVQKRIGGEAVVLEARRLWYWDGASSLSQLAMEGVSKPENCKFPITVPKVELINVIEVIECTEKAQKSIESVVIWKQ